MNEKDLGKDVRIRIDEDAGKRDVYSIGYYHGTIDTIEKLIGGIVLGLLLGFAFKRLVDR